MNNSILAEQELDIMLLHANDMENMVIDNHFVRERGDMMEKQLKSSEYETYVRQRREMLKKTTTVVVWDTPPENEENNKEKIDTKVIKD